MGCVIGPRRTVFSLKHRIAKRNFEVTNAVANSRTDVRTRSARAGQCRPAAAIVTRLANRGRSFPDFRWSFDLRHSRSHAYKRRLARRNGDLGAALGYGCYAQASCAVAGNCAAGKRPTVYAVTDFRPNQRLSQALVFRYWRARQERAIACGYRQSRGGSAVAASTEQSFNRKCESGASYNHTRPLSRT